jgi:hypothetical protein
MRLLLIFLSLTALAQKKEMPQPRVVNPEPVPSDAIVLFGPGASVEGWTKPDGSPTGCRDANGEMVCVTGSKDAVSKVKFGAVQLHLEFMPPVMPQAKGQLRGNSGVYLQGRYEVQVLDSFENPTYADGTLGAVYGESAPLVNAAKRPGQWQTYDMIFHPHKCDASGKVVENGTVTVLLNGVLVQDRHTIRNTKDGCGDGPLLLQDHSGFPGAPHTEMKFRNIWIRRLD